MLYTCNLVRCCTMNIFNEIKITIISVYYVANIEYIHISIHVSILYFSCSYLLVSFSILFSYYFV